MTIIPVEFEDHNELLRALVTDMAVDDLLELLKECLSIPNEEQAEIVREELKQRK